MNPDHFQLENRNGEQGDHFLDPAGQSSPLWAWIRPPGQLNLFEEAADLEPIAYISPDLPEGEWFQAEEGITVTRSPEGLSLEIKGYGISLGKSGACITIKKKGGKAIWQTAIDGLSDLLIHTKGLSLSGELMGELSSRGVRVCFLGEGHKPQAQLSSVGLSGHMMVQLAQVRESDGPRGIRLARRLAAGKIKNQAYLLRYFGKNESPALRQKCQDTAGEMLKLGATVMAYPWKSIDSARAPIMGLEGTAARLYWNTVGELLGDKADFPGRRGRGATDPINACLNYGYSILYSHVWGAVTAAGLNPFLGVLHTQRSGKPSLVLDMVEIFRAPVVDRTVLAMVRLGSIKGTGRIPLGSDIRHALSQGVLERFDTRVPHGSGKLMVRSVIQSQTREVAALFCGKKQDFKPFVFRW